MARPATGQIVERADATGAIRRSLRFRTGSRRHTVPLGVVSRADAERELACVMADVARGVWKPPTVVEAPVEVERPDVPRVRGGLVGPQSGAARREHAGGLPLATGVPPAARVRRAANRPDRLRRGGALYRRQARRGQAALGAVDQHDGDAARGDPRARRETQADRPQPRRGQRPPRQGTRARAVVPGRRWADRGATGRGRRA